MVAAALAAWGRQHGIDIGVMKAVATGGRRFLEEGKPLWVSDDAVRLKDAGGVDDPWSLINPICFKEPLAPWTAAMRAHRPIRIERILQAFHALSVQHHWLIVEGVGGLEVPLTSRMTVADLAGTLRLPILLVASPELGTLNQTLLSLAAIRRRKLPLIGVVMNQRCALPRDYMSRVAIQTNPLVLRRFSRVPIFGPLSFRATKKENDWSAYSLSRWIEQALGAPLLHHVMGSRNGYFD